jgi:hypothetical protein
MTQIAENAAKYIRRRGTPYEPGLSESELSRFESVGSFTFGPDHRAFLSLCLPVGSSWTPWRRATDAEVQEWLFEPIDGVLFDVVENDFWIKEWGPRPTNSDERDHVARRQLVSVPKLVPLFAHRACVAAPTPSGSPVFSVHQTDTIYYGSNLLDYFDHEFDGNREQVENVEVEVPFWSLLASGYRWGPQPT